MHDPTEHDPTEVDPTPGDPSGTDQTVGDLTQAAAEQRTTAGPQPARHGRSRYHRLLLPTARSDVTLRWHGERDVFSLSLWHDDACAASATLTPADAAELAAYLVTRLAERSQDC